MSGPKAATPGPWQVHQGNAVISAGDHGRPVAVAILVVGDVDVGPYNPDTVAANARLIAAAPACADALVGLVQYLIELHRQRRPPESDRVHTCMIAALDVIRHITGGAA